MKIIRRIIVLLLTAMVAVAAQASDTPSAGKVLKMTGTVMVKLPGADEAVPATVGMMIPEGSEITTGDASQLMLKAHDGIVASQEANSTVQVEKLNVSDSGVRNTLLNLKSGNLVSNLDPTKKKLNNYGVRTPKGVAAARGTSFSVGVGTDQSFSVVATADSVTFTTPTGSFNIVAGNITFTPAGGGEPVSMALSEATGANSPIAAQVSAVMDQAVNAISAALTTEGSGLGGDGAVNLISQVVGVASAAEPAKAAAFTATAVTAATAPNSSTAGSASVAAAITTSAASGAGAANAGAVAQAAAAAAPAAQAGAVAAAATAAQPSAATSIAQGVSTAQRSEAATVAAAVTAAVVSSPAATTEQKATAAVAVAAAAATGSGANAAQAGAIAAVVTQVASNAGVTVSNSGMDAAVATAVTQTTGVATNSGNIQSERVAANNSGATAATVNTASASVATANTAVQTVNENVQTVIAPVTTTTTTNPTTRETTTTTTTTTPITPIDPSVVSPSGGR